MRFSDGLGWEGWADFNPTEVHKQYGLAFKTPKYRDGNLKDMVKVFLELYKPSDESVSEPLDFFFVPQERLLSPRHLAQAQAASSNSGFPAINGGGAVKDFKDLRIKQEMGEHQSWSQARWATFVRDYSFSYFITCGTFIVKLQFQISRIPRGFGSNGYISSSTQPGPALNIQQGSNGFHNNSGVSYNNNMSHHQQQQQQGHGGFVNNMTRMQHPAQSRNIMKEHVNICSHT